MRSAILDAALLAIDRSLFEPFRGKRVVVTGATGLVGSLVVKAFMLANEMWGLGCCVVAFARSAGKAEMVLGDYAVKGLLEVVVYDLEDGRGVEVKADYILHAASVTQSKMMVERPADVIKVALNGTAAMLDLSLKTHARMVYISSMEYYGSLNKGEVADEAKLGYIDLATPRACYPESKRACECLCNAYAFQYGVEVCSARLAQTVGAGVLPGENRAFFQFAKAAMAGRDIILATRGESEGNYVNTVDCVAALLILMSNGRVGQSYNVVNETTHGTIRDVAELAASVLGEGKAKVLVCPDGLNLAGYAPDVHLKMNSNKIRKLGWKGNVGLRDSFLQLGAYALEQGLVHGAK